MKKEKNKLAAVIDDDQFIRELISQILHSLGYTTFTYENPLEWACELNGQCECLKEAACFDVLITDLAMPGMDGIEFIRLLRKKQCRIGRFAIISGSMDEENKKEVKEMGCFSLMKPFDPDELVGWLDNDGQ